MRTDRRLSLLDAVDLRVIGQVRTHTGALIDSQSQVGGWLVLNSTRAPLDTDAGGLPDYGEAAVNLNPDCSIEASTNLQSSLNWITLLTTNTPLLPLRWTDASASNFPRRCYRVRLGP